MMASMDWDEIIRGGDGPTVPAAAARMPDDGAMDGRTAPARGAVSSPRRMGRERRRERRLPSAAVACMTVVSCLYVSGAVALCLLSDMPREAAVMVVAVASAAGVAAMVPAVVYRIRAGRR